MESSVVLDLTHKPGPQPLSLYRKKAAWTFYETSFVFHRIKKVIQCTYTKYGRFYCGFHTFSWKGSLLRSLSWVLLHIRGMNYKFHSLFLKGKWLVWLERKLISARQQPYGRRSGLSQSNPKDCIWLIISKHNRQISRGPPLLRFILAMTKVIMTRGEGKKSI